MHERMWKETETDTHTDRHGDRHTDGYTSMYRNITGVRDCIRYAGILMQTGKRVQYNMSEHVEMRLSKKFQPTASSFSVLIQYFINLVLLLSLHKRCACTFELASHLVVDLFQSST